MPENKGSTSTSAFHPTPGVTPEQTDKLMTDDILDTAGVAKNLPQREPPPQSVLANIPQPEATLPGVEYRTLQAAPPQAEDQPNRGKKKGGADDPFAWLAKRGKSDSNEK
ncbi:MAG: hypothetical protein U0641_16350 [Anaerolineae bacterium]